MDLHEKLHEVCRLFRIYDEFLGYETIQMGNVNRTYKVNFRLADGNPKSFLVQNVNTYAFRNPVALMDNIDHVTEHIRNKKPGKTALHFHHTADRKTYFVDGEDFWRMTNYIPSVTYGAVEDVNVVRNAGKAFGEFQGQLSDFDSNELFETIPGFHNTRQRYENFIKAVQENKAGRADEVREEIDFLLSVQDIACKLTDLQQEGKLPLRVTHNDTKINNVLFHPETYSPMIVIDLDTVMPGLAANDFGDSIRFGASTATEDEKDLSKVSMSLDLYRAYASGFLKACGQRLTAKEIETLPWGAKLMTLECGVRFLTDHLNGDVYFGIKYPEHNLVRSKAQFKLLQSVEAHQAEMQAFIAEIVK